MKKNQSETGCGKDKDEGRGDGFDETKSQGGAGYTSIEDDDDGEACYIAEDQNDEMEDEVEK